MSDGCCGSDEPTGGDSEDHEPERLWQVTELRFAAASGVLLVASLLAAWTAMPTSVVLAMETGTLLVGGWTFVPSTLRRLTRGQIGVGTLMTIAAVRGGAAR